jgi:hypothetical protein
MRVMLLIKGDPEPGAMPSQELFEAMGRYNDELRDAGVLLDLAGLHPSGEGKRVRFSNGERAVVDGPFDEKDAVAGYWILEVSSIEDAVGWAKRVPFEALARIYPGEYGAEGEVEIRQGSRLRGDRGDTPRSPAPTTRLPWGSVRLSRDGRGRGHVPSARACEPERADLVICRRSAPRSRTGTRRMPGILPLASS